MIAEAAIWILVLTCNCGQPVRDHFSSREACVIQAQRELVARNINVPSYRCAKLRIW